MGILNHDQAQGHEHEGADHQQGSVGGGGSTGSTALGARTRARRAGGARRRPGFGTGFGARARARSRSRARSSTSIENVASHSTKTRLTSARDVGRTRGSSGGRLGCSRAAEVTGRVLRAVFLVVQVKEEVQFLLGLASRVSTILTGSSVTADTVARNSRVRATEVAEKLSIVVRVNTVLDDTGQGLVHTLTDV